MCLFKKKQINAKQLSMLPSQAKISFKSIVKAIRYPEPLKEIWLSKDDLEVNLEDNSIKFKCIDSYQGKKIDYMPAIGGKHLLYERVEAKELRWPFRAIVNHSTSITVGVIVGVISGVLTAILTKK